MTKNRNKKSCRHVTHRNTNMIYFSLNIHMKNKYINNNPFLKKKMKIVMGENILKKKIKNVKKKLL